MRKQMLGTIIALLAVVLMAGAQTPDTGTTVTRAALQKVAIVPGDGGISIEMGCPSMQASASIPPTPHPSTPRPLIMVVCESVPTSVSG